jgi:tetratricopeptide (TPR) repeat protein
MNQKTTNKSIFVSSTFRDMQAERDALRDFVLPRVNEFASKYGRAVEIIDLRWGVDTASVSEEDQNKKVLRTCLDEIKRSRPFFLGLIGDRYGWTPPRPEMETAINEAQFQLEDLNMSVTALEIEYGVLHSDSPPVCLFYFRESPDYAVMPEKLGRIYQDGAENIEKLKRLKEEIRSRYGAETKNYTAEVQENGLAVSKDWADMVATDIMDKLRQEWGEPSDTPLGWKEIEREMQDVFRESRTAHFAGRSAAIADMAAFCLGDEPAPQLLMMQGAAGSGKSGLLCKVMDEIDTQCLLLPFCCGISSRSSLVENMLRYFITILCEKLALDDDGDEITKFQDLKNYFVELLFAACNKIRVVAVVDALDQLVGSDEARRMLWISGRLPENFRLLCSIIDGPETDAVKQLGGEIRPVPSIDTADEAAIIHGIAKRHHKQISSVVVEHILKKQTPDGAQAAQNPLYLSLITQELVMMDRYEMNTVQNYMENGMSHPEALAKFMRQRIDKIPGDPEGAYLAILNRMEKLIGHDFVRGVCDMIAVSRSGLRESDMEGAFKEWRLNFNPADFSWLRQMLRGHFSQGDVQQWDFAHQSLRRALRKDRPDELKRLSYGILKHFLKIMEQDNFAAREIMHHLCAASRPDVAAEVMAACNNTHYGTLAQGLADVYAEYAEYEEGAGFLLSVPANMEQVDGSERWCITETLRSCLPLLPENTRPFRIELMLAALSMLEGQEDATALMAMAYGEVTIAALYTETGQTEKAGEYCRKSLDAMEKLYGKIGTAEVLRDLSLSYERMGNHLRTLGQTEQAGEYYRKSLDASEKIFGESGTAAALRDLSVSYERIGDHLTALGQAEQAGEYYRKSLDAREKIYGESGTADALFDLSDSYDRIGDYLTALGQTEQAGEYYRKSLDARERIYGESGTADALRDLPLSYDRMGDHLTALGQMEQAGEYYRKSLDARERIYGERGTADTLRDLPLSYDRMGDHLTALGQTEQAGEYYRKSLDARERIYGESGTADALSGLSFSYDRMGDHLKALGQTEQAGEYYRKSLDAREKIYGQSSTAEALRDLSVSYISMGDYLTALGQTEKAGEYYQKSLDARERIYGQSGTAAALRDLSVSYSKMGDYLTALGQTEQAEEYYQKSLDADEQLYVQSGTVEALCNLLVSYNRMGEHLTALGQTEQAEEYYRKTVSALEQAYENSKTETMLNGLLELYGEMGDYLTAQGKTEKAQEYYQKALDAKSKINQNNP